MSRRAPSSDGHHGQLAVRTSPRLTVGPDRRLRAGDCNSAQGPHGRHRSNILDVGSRAQWPPACKCHRAPPEPVGRRKSLTENIGCLPLHGILLEDARYLAVDVFRRRRAPSGEGHPEIALLGRCLRSLGEAKGTPCRCEIGYRLRSGFDPADLSGHLLSKGTAGFSIPLAIWPGSRASFPLWIRGADGWRVDPPVRLRLGLALHPLSVRLTQALDSLSELPLRLRQRRTTCVLRPPWWSRPRRRRSACPPDRLDTSDTSLSRVRCPRSSTLRT